MQTYCVILIFDQNSYYFYQNLIDGHKKAHSQFYYPS